MKKLKIEKALDLGAHLMASRKPLDRSLAAIGKHGIGFFCPAKPECDIIYRVLEHRHSVFYRISHLFIGGSRY